jgi:hypothetical protein
LVVGGAAGAALAGRHGGREYPLKGGREGGRGGRGGGGEEREGEVRKPMEGWSNVSGYLE